MLCQLFPEQVKDHAKLHHKLDIQDGKLVELPIEPPPNKEPQMERLSDPHLDGLTQGQAAAYGEATGQLPASQPIDKQNKVQLGRIVHFTRTAGATCQASLVVHVWDKTGVNGCANLAVFNGNGALEAATATSVVRRKDGDAFGWHWPQECPAS